jgi:predicted glutamine amidotransferase
MFHLALTFGLETDVVSGVQRMAGYIEEVAEGQGVENSLQMTLGISNGHSLYAFRYSTEGRSRTLFHSRSMQALQELHPGLRQLSRDVRVVVSEPFSDLTDLWEEIPESTVVIVEQGEAVPHPFVPQRSRLPT